MIMREEFWVKGIACCMHVAVCLLPVPLNHGHNGNLLGISHPLQAFDMLHQAVEAVVYLASTWPVTVAEHLLPKLGGSGL